MKSELQIRDYENKYNLTRIRDKKCNFVLCEFQNRNSNTLFSLNSLNLFHFDILSSLNACILCNVQYSVLNSCRMYLIVPHILQIQNKN